MVTIFKVKIGRNGICVQSHIFVILISRYYILKNFKGFRRDICVSWDHYVSQKAFNRFLVFKNNVWAICLNGSACMDSKITKNSNVSLAGDCLWFAFVIFFSWTSMPYCLYNCQWIYVLTLSCLFLYYFGAKIMVSLGALQKRQLESVESLLVW